MSDSPVTRPAPPPTETLRKAFGYHPAGDVLADRGDGLHWLSCVECGREWAERDDGSLADGNAECIPEAALAALSCVEALASAALEFERQSGGFLVWPENPDCTQNLVESLRPFSVAAAERTAGA